jgi:sulfur carrier protein
VPGTVLDVHVVANGAGVELPAGATVADLLERLGMSGRWVLVERNGEPVSRRALTTTALAEGDLLEVVRAVAGG